jgi:hypothetical protein
MTNKDILAYVSSGGVLAVTATDIELWLKITVLALTAFYWIRKHYLLTKRNDNS